MANWIEELQNEWHYDLYDLVDWNNANSYLPRWDADKVKTLLTLGVFELEGTFIKKKGIKIPKEAINKRTTTVVEKEVIKEVIVEKKIPFDYKKLPKGMVGAHLEQLLNEKNDEIARLTKREEELTMQIEEIKYKYEGEDPIDRSQSAVTVESTEPEDQGRIAELEKELSEVKINLEKRKTAYTELEERKNNAFETQGRQFEQEKAERQRQLQLSVKRVSDEKDAIIAKLTEEKTRATNRALYLENRYEPLPANTPIKEEEEKTSDDPELTPEEQTEIDNF